MDMKKIGRTMNIYMGLTMSAALSIVGTVHGQATSAAGIQFPGIIIGILISFIASLIVSLIIGFIIPMKKVGDGACKAIKKSPDSFAGRLVSSLCSDLIYTPIITALMVALARSQAMKASGGHAQLPPFIIMYLPSLLITFIVGLIIIYFIQPMFLKSILKKNGINV